MWKEKFVRNLGFLILMLPFVYIFLYSNIPLISLFPEPSIFVTIAGFIIGLILMIYDLYIIQRKKTLLTTKAKILWLSKNIYINQNADFLLPNGKKLKLNANTIDRKVFSTFKKGDVVNIEYKGWRVLYIEKVQANPKPKPAQPTAKPPMKKPVKK